MTQGEIAPGHRKEFVFAGNAVVTLQGKHKRFTYRVLKNGNENSNATHWIHVLYGADNESDYKFLGGMSPHGFYVSSRSTIRKDAESAVAFAWFASHPEDPQVTVFHAGTCGRCGRMLTTPESIRTGLGPVCAEKERGHA